MNGVRASLLNIVNSLLPNLASEPVANICKAVGTAAMSGGALQLVPGDVIQATTTLALFLGGTAFAVCKSKKADEARSLLKCCMFEREGREVLAMMEARKIRPDGYTRTACLRLGIVI